MTLRLIVSLNLLLSFKFDSSGNGHGADPGPASIRVGLTGVRGNLNPLKARRLAFKLPSLSKQLLILRVHPLLPWNPSRELLLTLILFSSSHWPERAGQNCDAVSIDSEMTTGSNPQHPSPAVQNRDFNRVTSRVQIHGSAPVARGKMTATLRYLAGTDWTRTMTARLRSGVCNE
jgi:hypothetical protein